MNIKTGTQTWSNAAQKGANLGSDGKSNLSASEKNELFGGENIGDALNKIADPNYVAPEKKMRTVGNPELDKDAFLGLLLAQMKNQDPTNPMKSHEMAAQLAQFTSLEKLTNINSAIEGLAKAQKPGQNFGALALIGKAVAGDSSAINHSEESESHDIRFRLQADGTRGTVVIKNENGEVVRNLNLSKMKAGDNEIKWNGKNEDGRELPVGKYSASVEAFGSNGAKLFVDTKFEGTITGVNFAPAGPILMIGKQQVPLSEVKEIVDPSLLQAQRVEKLMATQGIPGMPGAVSGVTPGAAINVPTVNQSVNAVPKPVVKPETGKKAVNVAENNMESVAMSRDMINKLKKENVKAGL